MKEKTILERVKEFVGVEATASDDKIQGYIDLFCDKVKSICNISEFPQELNYLVVDFARKSFIYYKDKDDSSNEHLQATSASDNGQTVNFKTVETVTKDDVDLNKYVDKNKDEISMYACMRW